MRSAVAYAPGHVTGFFNIDDSPPDPLARGSLGAGFSIGAGVTTSIRLTTIPKNDPLAGPGNQSLRTRISINGSVRGDAIVSQAVVDGFIERFEAGTPERASLDEDLRCALLSIEHHIRVPESAGFGSSGAAALSLAFALNELFGAPLSPEECGQLAHATEIACGTGLGTVIGEYAGGCEIRVSAGAPGIGRVMSFEAGEQDTAVFLLFGPLPTRAALSDEQVRAGINAAGRRSVEALLRTPTMAEFMRLSREFAEASGLISERLRGALRHFDDHRLPASMLMFGDGLFTVVHRREVPEIRRIVDKSIQKGELFMSTIDQHGVRVIDED